jgi:hypothetical protein
LRKKWQGLSLSTFVVVFLARNSCDLGQFVGFGISLAFLISYGVFGASSGNNAGNVTKCGVGFWERFWRALRASVVHSSLLFFGVWTLEAVV